MSGVRPDLFARLHDDLEAGFREDLEEAVIDPARWPDLAERTVRASGSEGALLLRSDRTSLESLCTASLADASRRYFDEGWHREDHRLRGIPFMRTRGIAVDQDFTTQEEIAPALLPGSARVPRPALVCRHRLCREGTALVPLSAADRRAGAV